MFADSGAYSVSQGQAPVNVRSYGSWLLRWRQLFTAAVNLDVHGDLTQTLENQAYLESLGLNILPVYHAGDPMSALDAMLDGGYSYVGLGGTAGLSSAPGMSQYWKWALACFRRAEGRAVLHGFGTTNHNALAVLPLAQRGQLLMDGPRRYGKIPVFNERKGRIIYLDANPNSSASAGSIRKNLGLLERAGFPPGLLLDRELPDASRIELWFTWAEVVGVHAGALSQLQGPVPIPGRPEVSPGLHVYLVQAPGRELAWIARWYRQSRLHEQVIHGEA